MGIDPSTKKQLIEFAKSQMARKGEIDSLIFTTKNIMVGLQKASENLDKSMTDVNRTLHSIEQGAEND